MNEQEPLERYSRQILFRPIGREGQEKLKASRVAIVGVGALGTYLAQQLVRAGVGFVRVIDRDVVETTNLGRQVLYDEHDAELGTPKALAARQKLMTTNSSVVIEAVVTDLTWKNAEQQLSDVDVILDGTDNFQVRYLVNDVAVKYGIPWAYGGAVSSYGTSTFIQPNVTACLVCMFGENRGGGHDTCDTVGVVSPVVAMIASLQAIETLKYLTGNVDAMSRSITHLDVWRNEFQSLLQPPKQDSCRCCGRREFTALAVQPHAYTISLCGRRTIQVRPDVSAFVPLSNIANRLRAFARVMQNDDLLRTEIEGLELTLFADGRALVRGTDDAQLAKEFYAKYIGM